MLSKPGDCSSAGVTPCADAFKAMPFGGRAASCSAASFLRRRVVICTLACCDTCCRCCWRSAAVAAAEVVDEAALVLPAAIPAASPAIARFNCSLYSSVQTSLTTFSASCESFKDQQIKKIKINFFYPILRRPDAWVSKSRVINYPLNVEKASRSPESSGARTGHSVNSVLYACELKRIGRFSHSCSRILGIPKVP